MIDRRTAKRFSFLFVFKRTAPPNPQRGTPAGIPRYGAASRRLTYEERESQASAHWYFAFCFSSAQHQQTRTQTKKRWGPALGHPSWGLGNGWSPSQGRNSASSSQKFAHIKRNKIVSPNTERSKPQIQKPHAEKGTADYHSLHRKPKEQRASILHAALTENSRPPAGGYASVNRFTRNGGRSQSNINPQFRDTLK